MRGNPAAEIRASSSGRLKEVYPSVVCVDPTEKRGLMESLGVCAAATEGRQTPSANAIERVLNMEGESEGFVARRWRSL